jgi:hypothetical protein
MYLSETKILKNSLNRVSKIVLVIAISTNDSKKTYVAQSLVSIILGFRNASIIGAKLLKF